MLNTTRGKNKRSGTRSVRHEDQKQHKNSGTGVTLTGNGNAPRGSGRNTVKGNNQGDMDKSLDELVGKSRRGGKSSSVTLTGNGNGPSERGKRIVNEGTQGSMDMSLDDLMQQGRKGRGKGGGKPTKAAVEREEKRVDPSDGNGWSRFNATTSRFNATPKKDTNAATGPSSNHSSPPTKHSPREDKEVHDALMNDPFMNG